MPRSSLRKFPQRSQKGSANARAKLTEDQVREVRRRWKWRDPMDGMHVMAKEFGVTRAALWLIIHEVNWSHI